ncbi:MAG: hypothetical protein JO030_07145 [Candidatus Eremiobacteraeota bacterium]|nr:hypothetical protein [Candidatus Eremiobacteraeota bacterium]
MREPPRRRRGDGEPSEGGLPLFPLVLVVILAGLLLGGALAHFFGGSNRSPSPATRIAIAPATTQPTIEPSNAIPATRTPAPVRTRPAATPRGTPTAEPTAAATPTTAETAAVTPKATRRIAAASATPALVARATVAPAPIRPTAAPSHLAVAAGPTNAPSSSDPAGVVRAYLGALARGDRQTASGYLAHGTPTESFMTPGARIATIRSSSIGAQQYRVTADVQTGSGEYYVTFTVGAGPGGLQITDHYAIKPQ